MAYDWTTIKREFVEGYPDKDGKIICPTLEELHLRHGPSMSTMKKKSADDNWVQERNLYRTKIEHRVQEKKIEVLAGESANLDNKALNAADKGIEIGLKRLDDKDLSNHDYQKLSIAISNFHKMGKLALGEETEHTRTSGKSKVDHDIKFRGEDRKIAAQLIRSIHSKDQ
jgi:hypothetical protein